MYGCCVNPKKYLIMYMVYHYRCLNMGICMLYSVKLGSVFLGRFHLDIGRISRTNCMLFRAKKLPTSNNCRAIFTIIETS